MQITEYVNHFGISKFGVQAQDVKKGLFTWGQSPSSLAQALLQALHDLIHLVPGGDDQQREATILAAVGAIYDKYVTPAIPTLWRPLSPVIRYLVVNLVLPQVLTWLLADQPSPLPAPQPKPQPGPTVIVVPQQPNEEK